MSTTTTISLTKLITPAEAAELLRTSVDRLTELMRVKGYAFTSLSEGGRPGKRGPCRWGLTPEQLAAVIAGQAQQFVPPAAPEKAAPPRGFVPAAPDGKSRIKHHLKTRG